MTAENKVSVKAGGKVVSDNQTAKGREQNRHVAITVDF